MLRWKPQIRNFTRFEILATVVLKLTLIYLCLSMIHQQTMFIIAYAFILVKTIKKIFWITKNQISRINEDRIFSLEQFFIIVASGVKVFMLLKFKDRKPVNDDFRTFYEITMEYSVKNSIMILKPQIAIFLNLLLSAILSKKTYNKTLVNYNLNTTPHKFFKAYIYTSETLVFIAGIFCPLYFRNVFSLFICAHFVFVLMNGKSSGMHGFTFFVVVGFILLVKVNRIADTLFRINRYFIDTTARQIDFVYFMCALYILQTLADTFRSYFKHKITLTREARLNSLFFEEFMQQDTLFNSYFIPNFQNISNANHLKITNNVAVEYMMKFGIEVQKYQSQIVSMVQRKKKKEKTFIDKAVSYLQSFRGRIVEASRVVASYLQGELVYLMVLWHYAIYFRQNPLTVVVIMYIGLCYSMSLSAKTQNLLITLMIFVLGLDIFMLLVVNLENGLINDSVIPKIFGRHYFIKFFFFKITLILLAVLKFSNLLVQQVQSTPVNINGFAFGLYTGFIVVAKHSMLFAIFLIKMDMEREFAAVIYVAAVLIYIWDRPPKIIARLLTLTINCCLAILFIAEILEGLDNSTEVVFDISLSYYNVIITFVSLNVHHKYRYTRESRCDFLWFGSNTTSLSRRFLLYILPLIEIVAAVSMIYSYAYFPKELIYVEIGYYVVSFYIVFEVLRMKTHNIMRTVMRITFPVFIMLCADATLFVMEYNHLFFMQPFRRMVFIFLLVLFINLIRIVYTHLKHDNTLENLNSFKMRINTIQQNENFLDQPLLNKRDTILSRHASFHEIDIMKSNSFIKIPGNQLISKMKKPSMLLRDKHYYRDIKSDDDEAEVNFFNDIHPKPTMLQSLTRLDPTNIMPVRNTDVMQIEYTNSQRSNCNNNFLRLVPLDRRQTQVPLHWDYINNTSEVSNNLPNSLSSLKRKVAHLMESYFSLKFEYKRVNGLKNLRNMILQSFKIRLGLKNMDFAVVFTVLILAISIDVSVFNFIYLALMLNYLKNIHHHYNSASSRNKVNLYIKMTFENIIEKNRIEETDFVQSFLKDKTRFLTVVYEFYKQGELQRLLVFNIIICMLNLIFLRGYLVFVEIMGTNYLSLHIELLLRIIGAETQKTFPVVTLFMFFNLLCLMLNKIFLSAIKDVHLHELKRINSAKKSIEIENSEINDNLISTIVKDCYVKDDMYHKTEKYLETDFDLSQKLLKYKNMNSTDVIFANVFRFILDYINYIIVACIMFINFLNKNIFGIIILLYLLLRSSKTHSRIGSWVCNLIVFKLLLTYFLIMLYVNGSKEGQGSLIDIITTNAVIRFILENILIGKAFKLDYYFIESLLVVFFIVDQKMKISFNKYMISFVEKHQKVDHTKKSIQINSLVFFLRKLASFLLVNVITVYLLITVIMSYFFGNSLSVGFMNTTAFIFTYITDFRDIKTREIKMDTVVKNLKRMRQITQIALLIQQTLFIIFENLEWRYYNYLRVADFVFFLICFCLINGFLTMLDNCCMKTLIKGYIYDRNIKEHISIRMRANELHGLKVEAKYRQLINENSKERRLNQVFNILGQMVQEQGLIKIIKNKFFSVNDVHTHELKTDIPTQSIFKYNFIYLFYQCEYIINKYKIKHDISDRKKFVIDYFDGRLLENLLFLEISRTIERNYLYIDLWDFKKYTSTNIFKIETDRRIFIKLNLFQKVVSFFFTNIDQLLKLMILAIYVVQSGLLYKLLVLYCLIYDFLYIVPSDNSKKLMYIIIPLTVIKHLISNLFIKHILGTSGHDFLFKLFYYLYMMIGDLSPKTDLLITFWLCVVFLLGKFKMNQNIYSIYYSINFSKIFSTLSSSEYFMYSIIRDIQSVRRTTVTKLERVRFKVYSIVSFLKVRKQMRNFVYSNYLWEKLHLINPQNHLQTIFHPLLFKFGKNMTHYVIIVHIIIVVYIFIFYNLMFDRGTLILDSIKSSEINGEMVLFLIFWSICVIIDILLLSRQSSKWRTLQYFRLSRGAFYRTMFKRNVYKVINISRLEKKEFNVSKKYDAAQLNCIKTQEAKKNPLYQKYLFTMGLFITASLYVIYRSTQKILNEDNSYEIFTEEFMRRLLQTENSYISFFCILLLAYTTLSLLNVKIGSQAQAYYTSKQFALWKEYLYKALNLTPFVRELRIFLSWSVAKTSLDWSHWFIIDYAYFQCMHLFDVQYRKRQDYAEIPKYKKTLIGFIPSIGLFLLILGPLFLFSNFNPISQPNDLNSFSANLSLGIEGLSDFKIYSANNLMTMADFSPAENKKYYPYASFLNEVTRNRIKVNL